MRWTLSLSNYLAILLIQEWKKDAELVCSLSTEDLGSHIYEIFHTEQEKEKELDQEVAQRLDELEKTHKGQFERYKMYPLLKKKLAEQKSLALSLSDEEKKLHWLHLILDGLSEKHFISYQKKESWMRASQKAINIFMQQYEEITEKVRKKIHSLKKEVFEGSAEWNVLYLRYRDEELSRSRLGRS